jgi:pimeloyl-ACP methyl ester carboxylesterase
VTIELAEIPANGLTFTCRLAGPEHGEPVLLLHGFPETSYMWEPLMETLALAGYRCVAPDQRGYSPGARPANVDAYRYEELLADALAVADAAGFDRFHLIGHDWGSIVGWAALATEAGAARIKSWTSLSIAHGRAMAEAVRDDPDQQPYRDIVALFLSDQAETVMGGNDMAALKVAWSVSGDDFVNAYTPVFEQPGALTAALNWYRASRGHTRALAGEDDGFDFGPVATPTLVLWGKDDPYCRRMGVELAAQHMTGPYRLVELDASHWLVQEQFERVRDETLAHLHAHTAHTGKER